MAATMQVDVVSAEQAIFSGQAEFVVLPGEVGELGVYPRHTPLITRIRPGTVRIRVPGQADDELIFVAGGILEVQPAMVTVLADTATLDTLPDRKQPALSATCMTCHRGVSRPVPLATLVQEAAVAVSADSAISAYKVLRAKYYGRDAYDFSEASLNNAAFRTARAGKADEALKLLSYNETLYPNSSGMSVFKGNIQLMKGDTSAAEASFREAIRRDSTNAEAKGRLQAIGKKL